MKVSSARAVALLACMSCVSCGPAAPQERAPVAPLLIGPAAPAKPAPTPRTESGPKAPEDLALLVRIADAEQLAREVATLLPPSLATAASMLEPRQIVPLLVGKRLGEVVDLAQPIDVASLGSSTTTFVMSMAVKQDAESKLGEGLVLREEGGLLHVGKQDEAYGSSPRLQTCAFTAAVGRAPTRLVCASDDVSLKAGAPWLARNVAGEPLEADARLSLPGKVLREKRDSTAKAMSEAASAQLGGELVERFVEELERVDIDLRFQGAVVDVGFELRLSARDSMLGRVLVPRSKPAPPPPAFGRLPVDALVALHTTGALPEDIAPLRKALADNLEGTLVQDGYGAEKVHALRERLEALLLTGGPLVLGAGVQGGRDGADRALAALGNGTPKTSAKLEAQARAALSPWVLIELEEPAERWTQGLRDVVRRAEDADRTRRPGSKASTPRDPDGDHVDLKLGTLDPSLKLPADALHLEVLLVPHTKGKRPARRAHLLVVPKGAATWIGYGEDLAGTAARLRLALDDGTEAGTLTRSAEAASLRARPAVGAGLVALGAMPLLAAKTATPEDLQATARSASRIAGLGLRGGQTVTWTATTDVAPGGAARLSVHTALARQTATDLVRMLGL